MSDQIKSGQIYILLWSVNGFILDCEKFTRVC